MVEQDRGVRGCMRMGEGGETDGAGGLLPDGHRYRPTERRDGACSRGMLEHVKGC